MQLQEQATVHNLVDHLFRHESGKLVSVLIRIFGTENLDMAEDVVQDAMIQALEVWSYKGVPDNPSAWLFRVAKNKALNIINRDKYKGRYASDVTHLLKSEWTAEPALDHLFSEQEILDDQLRTMFTCCHPSVTPDSQIALTLKTLCGFGIPEIARAFLTTEENIKIPFEVPVGQELQKRLQHVLETIYLLFNEGYSASKGSDLIRYELCEEAIRLTKIIEQHPAIQNKSGVYALLALMQLNASRFRARLDGDGNLLTMEQQNRALWDQSLILSGIADLERSASYKEVSAYNIMAAISACHCMAPDFESTNWQNILVLYNRLVQLDGSPVVLLNRAIAVYKADGAEQALDELNKIKNNPALKLYFLLYSTEAELLIALGRFRDAVKSLETALECASLPAEKELLRKRLIACQEKISK